MMLMWIYDRASGDNLEDFAAAAAHTNSSTTPDKISGGVIKPEGGCASSCSESHSSSPSSPSAVSTKNTATSGHTSTATTAGTSKAGASATSGAAYSASTNGAVEVGKSMNGVVPGALGALLVGVGAVGLI